MYLGGWSGFTYVTNVSLCILLCTVSCCIDGFVKCSDLGLCVVLGESRDRLGRILVKIGGGGEVMTCLWKRAHYSDVDRCLALWLLH